jgi:hypothetical protein
MTSLDAKVSRREKVVSYLTVTMTAHELLVKDVAAIRLFREEREIDVYIYQNRDKRTGMLQRIHTHQLEDSVESAHAFRVEEYETLDEDERWKFWQDHQYLVSDALIQSLEREC